MTQSRTEITTETRSRVLRKAGKKRDTMLHILLGAILGITIIIVLIACEPTQEDITIYSLMEENYFSKLLVSQYNKSQKKYKMVLREIVPPQLQAVLENQIKRENLFLLLSSHDISSRAKDLYFVQLLPQFMEDMRVEQFSKLSQQLLDITDNYSYPFYIYDLHNELGVSFATLSIPNNAYKEEEHSEPLRDAFNFFAQSEVNAQAYFYDLLPVYSDATLDVVNDNEIKKINKANYPLEKLEENFTIKNGAFSIRRF